MLPQNTNGNQVQLFTLSEDKRIAARQQLLMVPEVIQALNERERMVAIASVKMPIKQYPAGTLLPKWTTLVMGIARDVGVNYWNDANAMKYPTVRSMDIVSRHYKNLTIPDVKMAFELLLIGDLDDYLPKDRHGVPDKNHYQELSLEYWTKVLNAYNKRLAEIWHKANKSVPRIETTISQKTRNENYNCIVEEIYEAFDKFKANKTKPEFVLQVQINVLIENNLLTGIEAPDKKVNTEAYNKLLFSDHLAKVDRSKMIEQFERNKTTYELQCEAQRIQNNKTIANYFHNLVKAKKDIRDQLKKIE